MLHELERSLDHCVLEVSRRVERRDLASQVLTNTEMFGTPSDGLLRSDQASRNPAHRLFTTLLGSEQMNLNAARKIEAALNGSIDLHALFYANHRVHRQSRRFSGKESLIACEVVGFGNLARTD